MIRTVTADDYHLSTTARKTRIDTFVTACGLDPIEVQQFTINDDDVTFVLLETTIDGVVKSINGEAVKRRKTVPLPDCPIP